MCLAICFANGLGQCVSLTDVQTEPSVCECLSWANRDAIFLANFFAVWASNETVRRQTCAFCECVTRAVGAIDIVYSDLATLRNPAHRQLLR